MKLRQHLTEEHRAKLSAAHMGHAVSAETRVKMSVSHSNPSTETRARLSAAMTGRIVSSAARAKLSATIMGHIVSPEARAKISIANSDPSPERRAKISAGHMGIGHASSPETNAKISKANWKGGRVASTRKDNASRRLLGFVTLNAHFPDSEGHHVDNEQVIYMPKALHRSVFHRQLDGLGMAQINAIAYNFLFKQEVEAAIAAREATIEIF